jgi:hypothetical protein
VVCYDSNGKRNGYRLKHPREVRSVLASLSRFVKVASAVGARPLAADSFPRFRNSENVKVWPDRIADRHIVSVQAAGPGPSPPGQSQRAKRVLVADTKGYWNVSVLDRSSASKQMELLKRLEPLEQASLR